MRTRSSVLNPPVSRLDPARLSRTDRGQVRLLLAFLQGEPRPALVSQQGERMELPRPVCELLLQVVAQIQRGDAVSLVPEHEELTTQAAANHLGISRPFLIKLLEQGEIPFRKAGTHRRILFRDVLAYARERGAGRRKALDRLTQEAEAAGVYDRVAAHED